MHPLQLVGQLGLLLAGTLANRLPACVQLPCRGCRCPCWKCSRTPRAPGTARPPASRRLLGRADLVLAERLPVGALVSCFFGRAVADVAVDDDERGPVLLLKNWSAARAAPRSLASVTAWRSSRTPRSACRRPRRREPACPSMRDVVVVVDPAEVRQLQVTGERRGLRGDALHHVAVAADGVDVVVEEREVRPVERARASVGDRHPHRVRRRPGRAGRWCVSTPVVDAVLRVARGPAVELPEALDVVERTAASARPR